MDVSFAIPLFGDVQQCLVKPLITSSQLVLHSDTVQEICLPIQNWRVFLRILINPYLQYAPYIYIHWLEKKNVPDLNFRH